MDAIIGYDGYPYLVSSLRSGSGCLKTSLDLQINPVSECEQPLLVAGIPGYLFYFALEPLVSK